MFNDRNAHAANHDEAQWISLSDLMTGLMMIFMLIAIVFLLKVQTASQQARNDAISYEPVKNEGVPPAAAQVNQASNIDKASSNGKKAAAANKSAHSGMPQSPLSYEAISQEIAAAKAPAQDQIEHNSQQGIIPGQSADKNTAIPTVPVRSEAQQMAVSYDATKKEIYEDLTRAFAKDLKAWGAEISKDDLIIRFNEPDVLFNTGDATLRPKFQDILKEFFPRYVAIITADKYKNVIQEVRIEGHTSSKWNGSTDVEEAYFKNMELSQSRTRSTLRYVLGLPAMQSDADWLRSHFTANGLSSSRLIRNVDGSENGQLSQRVEFRIRTDADGKLDTIANLKSAQ